jgi:hypothetical protein
MSLITPAQIAGRDATGTVGWIAASDLAQGPATPSSIGAVKPGSALSVASDGTLSVVLGNEGGSAADGGLAEFTANKNAASGYLGIGSDGQTPGVQLLMSQGLALATAGNLARTFGSIFSDSINVKNYGALGNVVSVAGTVSITSGTTGLTVVGASFTAGDVNKLIEIPGADTSGGVLCTTIAAVISATQITLAAQASTTLSAMSETVTYGTDDSASISTACSYAIAHGKSAYFPEGTYFHRGISANVPPIRGDHWQNTMLRLFGGAAGLSNITVPSGNSGFTLMNVTIDNGSNPNTNHGVSWNSTGGTLANKHNRILHCRIQNIGLINGNTAATQCGLYTNGMLDFIVDGLQVYATACTGIFLDGCAINVSNVFSANLGAGSFQMGTTPNSQFPTNGEINVSDCFTYNTGLQVAQDNFTGYASVGYRISLTNCRGVLSQNHNFHVGGDYIQLINCRGENPVLNNFYVACRIPGTQTLAPMKMARIINCVGIEPGTGQSGFASDLNVDSIWANCQVFQAGTQATTNGFSIRDCQGCTISNAHVNGVNQYGINLAGSQYCDVQGGSMTMATGAIAAVQMNNDVAGTGFSTNNMIRNVISAVPGTYGVRTTGAGSGNNSVLGCTMLTAVNINAFALASTDLNQLNLCYAASNPQVLGQGNIATGTFSFTMGRGNTNKATDGVGIGHNCSINTLGVGSQVRGTYATIDSRSYTDVWAGSLFATTGDAKAGQVNLSAGPLATAGGTLRLTSDGSGVAGAANVLNQENNSTLAFTGQCVVVNGSTDRCMFDFEGLILRGTSNPTTVLVGATPTQKFPSSGATTWTLTITADTTNGGLSMVVGSTATLPAGVIAIANVKFTECLHA